MKPAVKNVGEPCAGEPLARIDAAAGGDQRQSGSHSGAAWALPPILPLNGSPTCGSFGLILAVRLLAVVEVDEFERAEAG